MSRIESRSSCIGSTSSVSTWGGSVAAAAAAAAAGGGSCCCCCCRCHCCELAYVLLLRACLHAYNSRQVQRAKSAHYALQKTSIHRTSTSPSCKRISAPSPMGSTNASAPPMRLHVHTSVRSRGIDHLAVSESPAERNQCRSNNNNDIDRSIHPPNFLSSSSTSSQLRPGCRLAQRIASSLLTRRFRAHENNAARYVPHPSGSPHSGCDNNNTGCLI